MRSVRVYGGLPGPRAKQPGDLVLDPATPQQASAKGPVKLHELTRKMVSDLPERLVDLLDIASYTYSADQFTQRDTGTMPDMGSGWRRSFALHVAVRDLAFWTRAEVQEQLASTLGFLSDDNYHFTFSKLRLRPPAQGFLDFSAEGPARGFVPDQVLLFSGGLDSFAGTLEAVLDRGHRVALVSHKASPMVASFQRKLVQALRQRAGPDRVLHLSVGVTKGGRKAVEFTQRTRSFLFAVLGFLVAHLFNLDTISFYENGIVSLNLPLASHVLGSRATRTTHPRVLHDFGVLFTQVSGRDMRVNNPFFWKTKEDVVRRIAELGCGPLIPSTFSCASVREATRNNGRHCGVCSQCLDRRFGVLAADCGRFEPPGVYDLDLFRGERKPGEDAILAESYVLAAHRHGGSTETGFLGGNVEILRAIPYLHDLPQTEAVGRLQWMHQRHGQAVTRVVEQAVADANTIGARLNLPDTSLLAMILGPQAQDIVCTDPAEMEPPAAAQAEARPISVVPRPIGFAAEGSPARAVFTDRRITLRGKTAELILALLPAFRQMLMSSPAVSGVPYVKSAQLAETLGISEPALRQLVHRLREELGRKFRHVFDAELQHDDVIQSLGWKGYRLNSHLAFAPALLARDGVEHAAE